MSMYQRIPRSLIGHRCKHRKSNHDHQKKMASVSDILDLDEKDTILDLVYSSYDTEQLQGLSPIQLQSLYEDLRHAKLNISQIEAAINYTCACPCLCDREELLDVLKVNFNDVDGISLIYRI